MIELQEEMRKRSDHECEDDQGTILKKLKYESPELDQEILRLFNNLIMDVEI